MAPDRVGNGKVRPPKSVLLDSSFLIAVMETPTPWQDDLREKIGSFQPFVIQPVYDELARLSAATGRASRFASLSKELVDNGSLSLKKAPGRGTADDELVSTALDEDALVATLDAELIRQLKAANIGVITLSAGRISI